MNKVNVLGTEYDIVINPTKDNPKMEGASGYIELYSKTIVLKDIEPDKNTFENIEDFKKKVLRHEISHAFFHESGMQDYCDDEKLIDWLALMLPKITKAMIETECL
jgi:hypothetical protein